MAADSAGLAGVSNLSGVTIPVCYHRLLHHKQGERRSSRHRPLPEPESQECQHVVLTCQGDIADPELSRRLAGLLTNLSSLLQTEERNSLRVRNVEPWNSVRVTLTIPREAAARLRQLAASGDRALQAMGILSVQLNGDNVISLRMTDREVTFRSVDRQETHSILSLPVASSSNTNPSFRSPNMVAPAFELVAPQRATQIAALASSSPQIKPYPFASMARAANHHPDSRMRAMGTIPAVSSFSIPPVPFSTISTISTISTPPVPIPISLNPLTSLSSPLLVNLLQSDPSQMDSSSSSGLKTLARPVVRRPPGLVPTQTHLQSQSQVQPQPLSINKPRLTAGTSSYPLNAGIRFVQTKSSQQSVSSIDVNTVSNFNNTSNVRLAYPQMLGYSQFTAASSKPSKAEPPGELMSNQSETADSKKLIINPLTGELEIVESESSEAEEGFKDDVFLYSPLPRLNSDDSIMSRRNDTSDQSDSETTNKSTTSDVSNPQNMLNAPGNRRKGGNLPGTAGFMAESRRDKDRDGEKIKLRLKIERAESYKVDVTFVNNHRGMSSRSTPPTILPTATTTIITTTTSTTISNPTMTNNLMSSNITPPSSNSNNNNNNNVSGTPPPSNDPPRVPPLHISLRGRNAAVVTSRGGVGGPEKVWGGMEDKRKTKRGAGRVDDCGLNSEEWISRTLKAELSESCEGGERGKEKREETTKKTQEIGGKIKSELTDKIDRVSGKLKNDLSSKLGKEGNGKKLKFEESVKGNKPKALKLKPCLAVCNQVRSCEDCTEGLEQCGKRRHSGDDCLSESQSAQKVKSRSVSSDQAVKSASRRFDSLVRKARKESNLQGKLKHVSSRVNSARHAAPPTQATQTSVTTPLGTGGVTESGGETPLPHPAEEGKTGGEEEGKAKPPGTQGTQGESTQGEDSGIESMDASSEKSPTQNQGEGERGKVSLAGCDAQCLIEAESPHSTEPPQASASPPHVPCPSEPPQALQALQPSEPVTGPAAATVPTATSQNLETLKPNDALDKDSGKPCLDSPILREEGLGAKMLEGIGDQRQGSSLTSPSIEEMSLMRVKPPLYTYAKREEREDAAVCHTRRNHLESVEEEERGKRKTGVKTNTAEPESEKKRENNKSLLQQLLIVIPDESRRTRSRSRHRLGSSPNTPKSSPRSVKEDIPQVKASPSTQPPQQAGNQYKHSPRGKRKRRVSEVNNAKRRCEETVEKKGVENPVESSDDEPLIDLASKASRERDESGEKNKEVSIRNNNKANLKVEEGKTESSGGGTAPAVQRRSVRQTQGRLSRHRREPSPVNQIRRRGSRDK